MILWVDWAIPLLVSSELIDETAFKMEDWLTKKDQEVGAISFLGHLGSSPHGSHTLEE